MGSKKGQREVGEGIVSATLMLNRRDTRKLLSLLNEENNKSEYTPSEPCSIF